MSRLLLFIRLRNPVNPNALSRMFWQVFTVVGRRVKYELRPQLAPLVLSALQAIDPSSDLLLPLLTVLSNATAYPANQVLMREMRITERVAEMVCTPRRGWTRSCRVMLLQCLANMAVCPENHIKQICNYNNFKNKHNNCLDNADETEANTAATTATEATSGSESSALHS
ncbi:unnamed protein product [Heligmosomoides polygyrus]|uniref:Uncharacterized protein n=1 Tax=Heligmosomoides polygyrus TaxID=6339 RepID=A0A3P8A7F0_HELPZ|nr:unnamed protein product [Heligmosomoides polygyrus]